MPELPEVETVRRGLAPQMEGVRVARLEQRRPDLRFPFPENFAARVEGCCVTKIDRRAKYLLAHLDSGETLVMHLGMSGRFSLSAQPAQRGSKIGTYVHDHGDAATHDHVVLHMANGVSVTYNDARRFGFMLLIPAAELAEHALFKFIGVEPLGDDLTPAVLARLAQDRKTDLKAFLLDQRHIAGLGNIYVSEAVHRAKLSPKRAASCLALRSGAASPHAERLVPEIKAVLNAALQAGGSTLRDYRHADGSRGDFQDRFLVYGRTDAPCPRAACTGTIKRIVQAGRSTFYCPKCQR